MADENRKFTRIPFDAQVQLTSADGSWDCELIDISLKGVLLEKPENWSGKNEDTSMIEIDLSGSDASIRMDVVVTHVGDNHIGLRCEHIDLDSIIHLRRLVELNVGDTDILDRELNALGK